MSVFKRNRLVIGLERKKATQIRQRLSPWVIHQSLKLRSRFRITDSVSTSDPLIPCATNRVSVNAETDVYMYVKCLQSQNYGLRSLLAMRYIQNSIVHDSTSTFWTLTENLSTRYCDFHVLTEVPHCSDSIIND